MMAVVSSGTYNYLSSLESSLANQVNKVSQLSDDSAQTNTVAPDSTAYTTDIVDISEEARTAAATSSSVSDDSFDNDLSSDSASSQTTADLSAASVSESAENTAASSGTTKNTAKQPPTPKAPAGGASKTDSSASLSADLSSYSEYQLKQMLQNERITQVQYNAEMARREISSGKSQTQGVTPSGGTSQGSGGADNKAESSDMSKITEDRDTTQ